MQKQALKDRPISFCKTIFESFAEVMQGCTQLTISPKKSIIRAPEIEVGAMVKLTGGFPNRVLAISIDKTTCLSLASRYTRKDF